MIYMETSTGTLLNSLRNAIGNQEKTKIENTILEDVADYICLLEDWMDENTVTRNYGYNVSMFLQNVQFQCEAYLLKVKDATIWLMGIFGCLAH